MAEVAHGAVVRHGDVGGRPRQRYYYPRFVVRLALLFDDSLQASASGDQISSADILSGNIPPTKSLLTSDYDGRNNASDRTSFLTDIIPMSCEVERSSHRQAGTFKLTIPWRDLPIPARLFRSIGVSIYAGCVPPNSFALGERHAPLALSGTRGISTNNDNLVMTGSADEIKHSHDNGVSTVEISGRDLSGAVIDAKIPPPELAKIDLGMPIDDVVRAVLSLDPIGKKLADNVIAQPGDWPEGIVPSPGGKDKACRVNLGADGSDHANNPPVEASKLSIWDVITHYCNLVGAIPYFHGAELRIRPGRAIYDKEKHGQFDLGESPFRDSAGKPANRIDSDGRSFAVRRFAYGGNILKVDFHRRFGGVKVPVIRVVGVATCSDKRGPAKMLEAEWPSQGEHPSAGKRRRPKASHSRARTTRKDPDGTTATDLLVIPVYGSKSLAQLQEIAKDLYEQIGRQEIGGMCEVKDLASLGGDAADADVLRMAPGDAVQFFTQTTSFDTGVPTVSRGTGIADLSRFAGASPEQSAALIRASMERHGFQLDENLARVVVALSRRSVVAVLDYYHVVSVRLIWDGKAGRASVSFEFDNFVIPKSDVTESTGPIKSKAVRKIPAKRPASRGLMASMTQQVIDGLNSGMPLSQILRGGNLPRGR